LRFDRGESRGKTHEVELDAALPPAAAIAICRPRVLSERGAGSTIGPPTASNAK
jgi:hypothetical protein